MNIAHGFCVCISERGDPKGTHKPALVPRGALCWSCHTQLIKRLFTVLTAHIEQAHRSICCHDLLPQLFLPAGDGGRALLSFQTPRHKEESLKQALGLEYAPGKRATGREEAAAGAQALVLGRLWLTPAMPLPAQVLWFEQQTVKKRTKRSISVVPTDPWFHKQWYMVRFRCFASKSPPRHINRTNAGSDEAAELSLKVTHSPGADQV